MVFEFVIMMLVCCDIQETASTILLEVVFALSRHCFVVAWVAEWMDESRTVKLYFVLCYRGGETHSCNVLFW